MPKIFLLFIITFCVSLLLFLNIAPVNAQELGGLDNTAGEIGYSTGGSDSAAGLLSIKIGVIIRIVLSLLGIIFFVIVWIGALDIAGANGNEEQVKKGKDRIINGAIGILVILIAYMFAYLILQIVNRGPFKI